MVYFTNDSEQYVSWNKASNLCGSSYKSAIYTRRVQLQDTGKKDSDGFTTEGLALGAQYEVSLFDP